jgi:pyrophosphatase PpaX
MANRGLELLDIKQYFKVIVTADDTGEHKPNPAPVLKALELLGAEPEEALMVGDSVFDIQCAHNAGVAAALVNWRAAEDYLYDEKPDFVVNDAMELVDIAIG